VSVNDVCIGLSLRGRRESNGGRKLGIIDDWDWQRGCWLEWTSLTI
jgi:hypothetical protein